VRPIIAEGRAGARDEARLGEATFNSNHLSGGNKRSEGRRGPNSRTRKKDFTREGPSIGIFREALSLELV